MRLKNPKGVFNLLCDMFPGATIEPVMQPYKARMNGWVVRQEDQPDVGVILFMSHEGPAWAVSTSGMNEYRWAPALDSGILTNLLREHPDIEVSGV